MPRYLSLSNGRLLVNFDRAVYRKPPEAFLDRTRSYWRLWIGRERPEETDLPERLAALYLHSTQR